MLDDTLFDDPTRLFDSDSRGLLRAAALAGAQVRAAVESVAELGWDDVAGYRPRALVLIARPGVGPGACRALAALLGSSCPVPVLVTDEAPTWIGPLDVVFAHADDPGDAQLAESVATVTRRGATVVLSVPPEGPVAAAASGRAKLVSPKVPVPPELLFAHAFAVGLSLLDALGLLRVDTELLADELDREAERAHPSHELVVNPAKSLALRLAEHAPLLWGLDPVSTAIAEHGAFALGCQAGVPCDVASYQQAVARRALHRVAAGIGSEADLFADPQDSAGVDPRVFLLSARYDSHSGAGERAAVQALPGADLVTPGESVRDDAVVRAALLALRFDLASVYLGLASGTLNGPGWQTLAVN
ncbi:hypothetical protein [Parasphingorhabdus pacifica]